jgi:hypothetical protein
MYQCYILPLQLLVELKLLHYNFFRKSVPSQRINSSERNKIGKIKQGKYMASSTLDNFENSQTLQTAKGTQSPKWLPKSWHRENAKCVRGQPFVKTPEIFKGQSIQSPKNTPLIFCHDFFIQFDFLKTALKYCLDY